MKELEYTKQVMHNAIAHHLLTDAQLVPEQQTLSVQLPPVYIPGMTSHMVWNTPLVFWVSCSGCVPSQLLVPLQPSCWLGIRS